MEFISSSNSSKGYLSYRTRRSNKRAPFSSATVRPPCLTLSAALTVVTATPKEPNMMVETLVRRVLAHPKRVWIVISITLGIGLLFTWPAVDSYSAAKDYRAKLESDLAE